MTAATLISAQAEAALVAFLRGIERRGLVLAEAQCGDPRRAQAAIAATRIEFRAHAASLPLVRWPALFWQLLLAQPTLRIHSPQASRDALSQLSAGRRAVLLLRLVAGLDQAHGAEVLRVSPAAYRHALYSALLVLQEQGFDEAAVRGLRDRLQQTVKPAPANQPTETARPGVAFRVDAAREAVPSQSAQPWLRPMLMVLLTMLLATFAVTFFWQPAFLRNGTLLANRFEMLRAPAPAATLSATATALAGADFELLNDPAGERIARDLDLYAWYAASSNAPAASPNPGSPAPAPLPESTLPETSAPDAEAIPAEESGAQ